MAENEKVKETPRLALVAAMPLEAFESEGDWTLEVFSRNTRVFNGGDVVDWGPWNVGEEDIKDGYLFIDQKIEGGIRRTFIGPNDDERLVVVARVDLTNKK